MVYRCHIDCMVVLFLFYFLVERGYMYACCGLLQWFCLISVAATLHIDHIFLF